VLNNQGSNAIINRIIYRKTINNNEEYALILNRVEQIDSDNSKQQEVEQLNLLLAAYHKQH